VTDRPSTGVGWDRVTLSTPTAALPVARHVALDFRDVYDAHVDLVWRTLRRAGVPMTHVDDAAQEVFLAVHRAIGSWEGRATLRTWIYRVARNAGLNYARSLRRRPDGPPTERADELPTGRSNPEVETAQNEALTELMALLDAIDEPKREVLVLVELEGFSAPEIAELLEIPLNTVYSRLRLARADLERAIAEREAP
jgi:RNA polymerase sigma-70 factor, ECF subfamily